MEIIVNLDVMMAKRKVSSKELASAISITEANLSLLKEVKLKASDSQLWLRSVTILTVSPGIFFRFQEPKMKNIKPNRL